MASSVCCEIAEIPSSNVGVMGMCKSFDDKGAILGSFRGGDDTGKGVLEGVAGEGGARVVATFSRKLWTAAAARL